MVKLGDLNPQATRFTSTMCPGTDVYMPPDPNHSLLPIALDCLKDADGERPSAQQLCERLAALKETAKHKNASDQESEG